MIKLKDLIKESISADAIRNYWNFVINALSGHNPDAFYRQHRQDIDSVADALKKKYGPNSGGTVYRGIILDESEVHNGVVNHVPEVTYVSFSEDKKIAVAFGDTDNPMWEFGKSRYPNKKGYLITQSYSLDLLLFHHSWLGPTNMLTLLRTQFGNHAKYIEMQKEVILKPQSSYKVEPVEPGASNGLDVGA